MRLYFSISKRYVITRPDTNFSFQYSHTLPGYCSHAQRVRTGAWAYGECFVRCAHVRNLGRHQAPTHHCARLPRQGELGEQRVRRVVVGRLCIGSRLSLFSFSAHKQTLSPSLSSDRKQTLSLFRWRRNTVVVCQSVSR